MKKFLWFLLLILPVMVKADMGSPYIEEYQAYVNKVEGISYYNFSLESEGTLSYNEVITIEYEEKINNQYYGHFINGDLSGWVKLGEVTVLNESDIIDESKYLSKENRKMAKILNTDGVIIYNGPAYGYSNLGTIPYLQEVELLAVAGGSDAFYFEDIWFFVEYNGVKGWICRLEGAFGIELNLYNRFSSKEIEITDKNGVLLGFIPANILLPESTKYYGLDAWTGGGYITYNGITGYINLNLFAAETTDTITVKISSDRKIYQTVDEDSKVLGTVLKDTKLKMIYITGDKVITGAYIEYNGIKGWITVDEEIDTINWNDTNFGDNNSNEDNTGKDENLPNDEPNKPSVEPNVPDFEDNDNVDLEENNTLSGRDIVILCVFGAIILSLTVTVTIILINDRKKTVN